MFPLTGANLPSLLIVENKGGSVFFVETNETESQVDRILRNKVLVVENTTKASDAASSSKSERTSLGKNGSSSSKRVLEGLQKLPEKPPRKIAKPFYAHTPMILKEEIKEEPRSSDDEDDYFKPLNTIPLAPSKNSVCPIEEVKIKTEPNAETAKTNSTKQVAKSQTFNGNWSSDDEGDYFDNNFLCKSEPNNDIKESDSPRPAGADDCSSDDDNHFNVDLPDLADSSSDSDSDVPLITLKKKLSTKKTKVEPSVKKEIKKKEKPEKSEIKTETPPEIKVEFLSIFPDSKRKRKKFTGKNACKFCETLFKHKSQLARHKCKYLTSDKKSFICRVCSKVLSIGTFSNHHHEESDCPYCGKSYVNPRNMRRHIDNAHKHELQLHAITSAMSGEPQKPYVAPKKACEYSYTKGKFECDYCGKYLYSLNSMYYHLGMHTGISCSICENCGEKTYSAKGGKIHNCTGKVLRRREFRVFDARHCRYCNTYFNNMDENKAHLCAYQDPTNKNMTTCYICKKYIFKSDFKSHMERHGTQNASDPFKCEYCNEFFPTKAIHLRHMKIHGVVSTPHRCEYCGKELSRAQILKKHIKRVHERKAICEVCKQDFPSRGDLKQHAIRSHEPFPCLLCDRTFIFKRYLKLHEQKHYGKKPQIQCPYCPKKFGKMLQVHIARDHPRQLLAWQAAEDLKYC